uniref:Cyclin-J-like protein n=1 Tax=Chelonoidis abingdonii TaxID=106734 RepID=A0A8C0ISP2_CHEAB
MKLPVYKAHSPQIGMRRYFTDLLTVLSSRCNLCPTARHLAVYLLDLFMDHYDITVKQLHVISIACLLLASNWSTGGLQAEGVGWPHGTLICPWKAVQPSHSPHCPFPVSAWLHHNSKFEEKEDRVPKLQQLNNLAYMCNMNVVLNKKDLLKMELLLLENFNWNLCLPTPAHYIDYYLFASVGEKDLHNGWPITSLTKVKTFMEKYAYYFLDFSVQDYAFLNFRPSLIAAACVCASRICMQISPSWTTQLQMLTCYSWEHLAQCIEMMLIYYENDVKEASKVKKQITLQQQVVGSVNHQTTTQVLFQQSSYHPLAQHSTALSQFQCPVQDLCSAYRDSLQAHRPSSLLSGSASTSLHSYSALQASLQPSVQTLPIQGPITMQVAIATEPRHCISMAYGSSYFSGHHTYTPRCFDR